MLTALLMGLRSSVLEGGIHPLLDELPTGNRWVFVRSIKTLDHTVIVRDNKKGHGPSW